mmetsp:Transcript_53217/g.60281  ORF Transcript_53217/g.60281 Transcript_53217/m.60281 type:complete len:133 (-) Transcript_53217:314-712(-)
MMKIYVLVAALVAIISRQCCDAFQSRIQPISSRGVVVPSLLQPPRVGYDHHEIKTTHSASKRRVEEDEQQNYFTVEDGSLLGVFTVALGFSFVQYFGDTINDKDFINEYGVIVILLAGSVAAGISRLIRNKL